ncbi:Uncharacterised protein [Escherichia coli]|nr:Uncharacterised protein [Escherichia coli]
MPPIVREAAGPRCQPSPSEATRAGQSNCSWPASPTLVSPWRWMEAITCTTAE